MTTFIELETENGLLESFKVVVFRQQILIECYFDISDTTQMVPIKNLHLNRANRKRVLKHFMQMQALEHSAVTGLQVAAPALLAETRVGSGEGPEAA